MAAQLNLKLVIDADVSTAQKASNALHTTLKQINKEAKATGSAISKGADKIASSLGKASTSADKLSKNLKGAAAASKTVASGADKVSASLKSAGAQGVSAGNKISSGMKQSVSAMSIARAGAAALGVTIGVELVRRFGSALVEQEKLRNQLTVLRGSKGYGGLKQDFERISELTGGMARSWEMAGAVNKAMAFGLDLSGGKLGRLIQVAQKASVAMGTDLRKAFDDIVTASGRGSIMIADNLGVVMTAEEANKNYAASIGKATDQLTKQEKATAFLMEMTRKMEKAYKDIDVKKLESKAQRVQKRFEDMGNTIKNAALDFADGWFNAMDKLGGAFANSGKSLKTWQNRHDRVIYTIKKADPVWAKNHERLLEMSNDTWVTQGRVHALEDRLKAISKAQNEAADAMSRTNEEMEEQGKLSVRLSNALLTGKITRTGEEDEDPLTGPRGLKISKEKKRRMKAYRNRKKRMAEQRAERISNAKSELNVLLKLQSQGYDISLTQMENAEYKLATARAAGAAERMALTIAHQEELTGLEKQAALKKFDIETKALDQHGLLNNERLRLDRDLSRRILAASSDTERINAEVRKASELKQFDDKKKADEDRLKQIEKANLAEIAANKKLNDQLRKAGEAEGERRNQELAKRVQDAQDLFATVSGEALSVIEAAATQSADTVLISIGKMASGYLWNAGMSMASDGIATLVKASTVATWPFIGPALAAPMFASGGAALAQGAGFMALGGLGTFAFSKMAASSGGESGTTSTSAQEASDRKLQEDTISREQQNTVIVGEMALYPSRTAMKKGLVSEGVVMRR